ncbi:MAG TPA: M48 family metallopeptidase [Longimicrobium sp.]|jgi:Zn-dependent protease with chaperone function
MQTSAEFDSYVARLERVARANPGRYRTRVLLFGALGYVYVFAVLVLLVALGLGVGALVAAHGGWVLLIKLAIPIGLLVWTIVRAMWVRIDPPQGKELARNDAPALFAEVDAIRRGVQAPRAHHVLLTDDFNASVSQVPRLGMFGWHRNYLVLGVPLMHALPADEFRAVLAHEFGHLSRAHGRSGAWSYRIRATWARILEQLRQNEHGATFVFERFFAWYAPRFAAYSFVLARSQEFEADARAAALVGPGVMASALARIAVRSRHLADSFWPTLWKRAAAEPEPPADAFTTMGRSLRAPMPEAEADLLLSQALSAPTRSGDTHPELGERIAALGVAPGPALIAPDEGVPSAAEAYLGRPAEDALRRMDREWLEQIRAGWTAQHQEARQAAERLAELEARTESLTPEEAKERAFAVASLHGAEAAVPLFRDLAEAEPADAQIRYMLGQLLLECDDEEGLRHLESAMAAEVGLVHGGCAASHAFLHRAGRVEEAEAYWRRLQEHADLMSAAQEERNAGAVSARDVFLPHGLDDEAVRAIEEALRRHRDIASAFLVRKEVKILPEHPLYVLAVVPDWTWKRGEHGNHSANLVQRLVQEIPFPGDAVVLTLEGNFKNLRKPIAAVAGSDVYVRGRRVAPQPIPEDER